MTERRNTMPGKMALSFKSWKEEGKARVIILRFVNIYFILETTAPIGGKIPIRNAVLPSPFLKNPPPV